jgi:hypothetical protein
MIETLHVGGDNGGNHHPLEVSNLHVIQVGLYYCILVSQSAHLPKRSTFTILLFRVMALNQYIHMVRLLDKLAKNLTSKLLLRLSSFMLRTL